MGRQSLIGRELTSQNWIDVSAMYQDGVSLNGLASLLGLSREYVRRHLRDIMNLRKAGREKKGPIKSHVYFRAHPLIRGAYARVLAAVYEGYSIPVNRLAKCAHVTPLAIRDMLIEQGITIREADPHRSQDASQQVQKALKAGRLVRQACEVCQRGPMEEDSVVVIAHHDDYNHPLKVRWLCAKHHKEWHKNNSPVMKEVNFYGQH